jgi:hypothetical protein
MEFDTELTLIRVIPRHSVKFFTLEYREIPGGCGGGPGRDLCSWHCPPHPLGPGQGSYHLYRFLGYSPPLPRRNSAGPLIGIWSGEGCGLLTSLPCWWTDVAAQHPAPAGQAGQVWPGGWWLLWALWWPRRRAALLSALPLVADL